MAPRKVKTYKDRGAFDQDAERMARRGWTVEAQAEQAGIHPRKPKVVVTWRHDQTGGQSPSQR